MKEVISLSEITHLVFFSLSAQKIFKADAKMRTFLRLAVEKLKFPRLIFEKSEIFFKMQMLRKT